MAVHGWKFDLEFLSLAVMAGLTASLLTTFADYVVYNALTTVLIALLFFLIGIHLDTDRLRKNLHHRKEIGLGLLLVYVFTPLLSLLFSYTAPGSLGEAFLAVGVSAAAIGAPVVWTNVGRGEGTVALAVSALSVIMAVFTVPVLLQLLGTEVAITTVLTDLVLFAGIPLLLGVTAQNYSNFLFDDFRSHFSKLALWLILLVTGIQGYRLFAAEGVSFIGEAVIAVPLLAGFVLVSFAAGYLVGMVSDIPERKTRALAFTAASKSLGISLLVATQISGSAVAFVLLYFLIRQAVCAGLAEVFQSEFRSAGFLDRISF